MRAPARRWYVLAFGPDAAVVAETQGVQLLRRLPGVALVEASFDDARAFRHDCEYVAVYPSREEGLRAFAVFEA